MAKYTPEEAREDEIRCLRTQLHALGGDTNFVDQLPKALGVKNREDELNYLKHFFEAFIELYKSSDRYSLEEGDEQALLRCRRVVGTS